MKSRTGTRRVPSLLVFIFPVNLPFLTIHVGSAASRGRGASRPEATPPSCLTPSPAPAAAPARLSQQWRRLRARRKDRHEEQSLEGARSAGGPGQPARSLPCPALAPASPRTLPISILHLPYDFITSIISFFISVIPREGDGVAYSELTAIHFHCAFLPPLCPIFRFYSI